MGQQVYQHTLANGLVLLAERMDHVRSAAINFLVPAGSAFEGLGRLENPLLAASAGRHRAGIGGAP